MALFAQYLYEHYVSDGRFQELLAGQRTGTGAVDDFLRSRGIGATGHRASVADFHTVFADWMVANFLDWEGGNYGRYGYRDLDIGAATTHRIRVGQAPATRSLHQYGVDYVAIDGNAGNAVIHFEGQGVTSLLPTSVPQSGCWWSGADNNTTSTLTRRLWVPEGQQRMGFRIWYDIERNRDHLYLEVSDNNGATWRRLHTPAMGSAWAFTGKGGWVAQSASLHGFTGRQILVRFRYRTNAHTRGSGACLSDIGMAGGPTAWIGGWHANGFYSTDNRVRQDWIVWAFGGGFKPQVRPLQLQWNPERDQYVATLPTTWSGHTVIAIAPAAPRSTGRVRYSLWATGTVVDTEPDPFSFSDLLEAEPGAVVRSDVVRISGLDAPAAVSVRAAMFGGDDPEIALFDVPRPSRAQMFINGVAAPEVTTISNGDTLQLETTAGSTAGDALTVSVTVGGVGVDWQVKTRRPKPTADAGQDRDVPPGAFMTLQGAGSGNPYGAWYHLRFQWEQLSGPPVSLNSATAGEPTFVVPADAASGATMEFRLTVTDKHGESDSDLVTYTVQAETALRPTACAGPDLAAGPGEEVRLAGTCSENPYGRWWTLAHRWTQVSGPPVTLSDLTRGNPTFTVPSDASNEIFQFKLTVTDREGVSDSDTMIVIVAAADASPAPDASEYEAVVQTQEETTQPAACITQLGELGDSVQQSGDWSDRDCRAHHRSDRPARYFSFTLAQQRSLNLQVQSDGSAAMFISRGTPNNGWGAPPKGSMEHRLRVRTDNGKLVHQADLTAALTLGPGDYTVEVVSIAADTATFELIITTATPVKLE